MKISNTEQRQEEEQELAEEEAELKKDKQETKSSNTANQKQVKDLSFYLSDPA
jgi:hypothetical protein